MKSVIAFVGSARTHGVSRGCKACFIRGEELCPIQDDRDLLLQKMNRSDGVVLASPVYSFQVSAHRKAFLDRLGFALHRPRFHGKAYTSIVVEGLYGGRAVVKYLEYYRERGWFDSDYYYPTKLGPLKRTAGAAFDLVAARSARPRHRSVEMRK